jgi:hypothetical protein
MTYKEAYEQILDWLRREHEMKLKEIDDINEDLMSEGVPPRGMARKIIQMTARDNQIFEIITEMEDLLQETDEPITDDQNMAIAFCHEHKLLMIPVDTYHRLNVSYYAFVNGITYDKAEKIIMGEGV